MLEQYYKDPLDAREAKVEIQKLSFYPMMFQAARVMRSSGILNETFQNRHKGIDAKTIAEKLNISFYGVNTLLEVSLTVGLVYLKKEDFYSITKMGYHLLFDEATRINLNFTNDVCYKALFHLEEAIMEKKAAGLHEIGVKDETIYPGLSDLAEPMKTSWFEFDHYYSDNAFPAALKIVFDHESRPKNIVDIGGNTGKWSLKCCEFDPTVHMTILDLPLQWEKAQENIKGSGYEDRISGLAGNVLHDHLHLPENTDAVWMSQFLDCFSYEQIVHILSNVKNAITDDAVIYIQELFWDRQKDFAAAYSLNATSLYFTVVANGNSKMYHSKEMYKAIHEAGLEVILDHDEVGDFHTILKCKRKK